MAGVSGLILRLKKWHIVDKKDQINEQNVSETNTHYHMWGYYDTLKLTQVNQWQDFNPLYINNIHVETQETLKYYPNYNEEFLLKLIMPFDEDMAVEKDENGNAYFDYDLRENTVQRSSTGPFIVVAMLHFSQNLLTYLLEQPEYNRSYCLLNKYLQEKILACNLNVPDRNIESILKELHCATYYTTGFSDMVVIFRTARIDWASDLIMALRCSTVPMLMRNIDKSIFLSTTYTISGIRSDYTPDTYKDLEAKVKDMRMSIRFLLKPGVSIHTFYDKIREQIVTSLGINEYELAENFPSLSEIETEKQSGQSGIKNGNLVSQMYGNSDMLLLPNFRPYKFLQEYTRDEGIAKLSSQFNEKYILSIRSSLRRIPSGTPPAPFDGVTNEEIIVQDNENQKMQRDSLLNIVTQLVDSLKKYYIKRNRYLDDTYNAMLHDNTRRYINGLLQTLELYLDMTKLDHAFDIRAMLTPVLITLYKNIDIVNERLQKIIDQNASMQEINAFISHVDENIETFRHELNELLLDFNRSDREHVEGRTLLHTAIGSATKLILAYSRILRLFSRLVRDVRYHDPDSSYAFLFSSGGVSQTSAFLYFKFIMPDISNNKILEHRLLQMKLPEHTLFRPSAATYLLCHEALHFVGYRNSSLRAIKVQQAVYAAMICCLGDLYTGINHSIKQGLLHLDESVQARIIQRSEVLLIEKRAHFQTELIGKLSTIIENEPSIPDEFLFADNLSAEIYERMHMAFVPHYSLHKDSLPMQALKRIYADFADVFYQLRMEFADAADGLFSTYTALREHSLRTVTEMPDVTKQYLDGMLGNTVAPYESDFNEAGLPEEETNAESINAPLRFHQPLRTTIDEYIDVFKEVFVDVVTNVYLDGDMSMFLSVFLCENEIPALAFPLTPAVVMRFGAILMSIDSVVNDSMQALTEDEFYNRLDPKMEQCKADLCLYNRRYIMMNDDQKADARVYFYVDHMRTILRMFWQEYYQTGIVLPLLAYAKACKDFHAERINEMKDQLANDYAVLETIRTLFHCNMQSNGDTGDNEKLAWQLLMHFWEDAVYDKIEGSTRYDGSTGS